jgi:hypothetical protein
MRNVGMFRVLRTSFRNAKRERRGTTSPKHMERRSDGAGTWRWCETIQTRFLDIPEVSQCLTVIREPAGDTAATLLLAIGHVCESATCVSGSSREEETQCWAVMGFFLTTLPLLLMGHQMKPAHLDGSTQENQRMGATADRSSRLFLAQYETK